MTKQEAREHFKLKDTDIINEKGVRDLLEINQNQLKTWSLTQGMRKELEKDIEACKALLGE